MDEKGVTTIQNCKPFFMMAVMMTCHVLKHQREIMMFQHLFHPCFKEERNLSFFIMLHLLS